jgi:hypothetical protein
MQNATNGHAPEVSPSSAYACGWYDKTRDDGIRFWPAMGMWAGNWQTPAYWREYFRGQIDRPHSGLHVSPFRNISDERSTT